MLLSVHCISLLCFVDEAAEKSGTVDHAIVTTLQQDKKELESKVKSLEVLVMRGTNALEEINTVSASELNEVNEALRQAQAQNIALQDELNAAKKKARKFNAEIVNLEHQVSSLESDLGALNDFEDLKNTFEEYQQEVQTQIDDERTKMEAEKESLQSERSLTMAERTHLDEKEGRLGLLLAALDERESKLRHHLNTLKEQESHWQQSIEDLTRREELVEEWQSNHRGREKKLQDWDDQLEKKFADLSKREAALVESEHAFKTQKRELGEREQRLQVALSRVAHTEQAVASLEEKLAIQENGLKVRESEMDVKEREIVVRRRELEQWDSLIREKDRKVVVEQRHLEEREDLIRTQEEKLREKEDELDNGLLELRQREADVKIAKDKYTTLLLELDTRESMLAEQVKNANNLSGSLSIKETQLQTKEARLNELEIKLKDTNIKTEEVNKKIAEHEKAVDKFFNHDVAQITARHAKETKDLEDLIQQQLVSVARFQQELEKIKEANATITFEKDSLREELNAKSAVISDMADEISRLEEEREALKQEAEEERKLMRASKDTGSPHLSNPENDEELGGLSDANGGSGGNYSKIANRSFLVQLAETQAVLKAVLHSQTNNPSTSFLGAGVRTNSQSVDTTATNRGKSRIEQNNSRMIGTGDYSPQQHSHDVDGNVPPHGNHVNPDAHISTEVGSSMNVEQSLSAHNSPHHSHYQSSNVRQTALPFPIAEPEYNEAKHEHIQPARLTSSSHISESALKKLGGNSTPRGAQDTTSPLQRTPNRPYLNKSKFEVIPSTTGSNLHSSRSTALTPSRDGFSMSSNTNNSGSSSVNSHGNTPVVSVELSLNRSGNRSKMVSGPSPGSSSRR